MIDPSEPKNIRFRREDQPELPEIDQQAIEAEREEEQRRKDENLRWLETHFAWRPFGDEW